MGVLPDNTHVNNIFKVIFEKFHVPTTHLAVSDLKQYTKLKENTIINLCSKIQNPLRISTKLFTAHVIIFVA